MKNIFFKQTSFITLFFILSCLCLKAQTNAQVKSQQLIIADQNQNLILKTFADKKVNVYSTIPAADSSVQASTTAWVKFALSNFVNKTTNQSIAGVKTFMDTLVLFGSKGIKLYSTPNANVNFLETVSQGSTYPWLSIRGNSSGSKLALSANNPASAADMLKIVADYTDTIWTGQYRPLIIDTYEYLQFRANRGNANDSAILFSIGNNLSASSAAAFFRNNGTFVLKSFQYKDGNQAAGKILVSDAAGNATWQTPGASGVATVFGRSGTVTATTGDYTVGQITGAAPLASPTFTGTVSGITSAMVGLGNVNNTSDANKPVSTAMQAALDLEAPLASPTFTGFPAAPTQSTGTSNTTLATTAFVQNTLAAQVKDTTFIATASQALIQVVNVAGKDSLGFKQQTANKFLASGLSGTTDITARAIVAADIPLLNQPTTSTAGNVTGIVAVANGGTGSATQNFVDLSTAQNILGLKTVQGAVSTDVATLNTELLTTGSGTNWTGSGFATGYLHTTGSVVALTSVVSVTNALYYQFTYTITGRTAGTISIVAGGISMTGISATGNQGQLTTSTSTVVVTPTTDFDGTLVLSVKQINTSTSALNFANSSNATVLEMRMPGVGNVGMGLNSGRRITTGTNNTAFGNYAATTLTSGFSNVAIGYNALNIGTTSSSNTAVGFGSLGLTTTGFGNTAFGASAFANSTTSSSTVSIGNNSARFIADGATALTVANNSVFIGSSTRALADGQTNQIVIGESAIGIGSNSVVLGNASVLTTALRGNVGIGTTTPGAKLDVSGASSSTNLVTFDGNRCISVINTDLTAGNAQSLTLRSTSTNGTLQSGVKLMGVNTARSTTGLTTDLAIFTNADGTITEKIRVMSGGNVGIGVVTPTAYLQIKAGAATASSAPIKLTAGTNLSTPENGAVEYDGTNYFVTTAGVRILLTRTITGTAAPAITPTAVGIQFVDTTNKKLYVATGTASSSDWTILN